MTAPEPKRSLPGELVITTHHDGDVVAVELRGELDLASAHKLEEQLGEIEAGAPKHVRIDLSGLSFMDSSGMRVLLLAQRRSQAGDHQLTLRRGPHQVQRVFELTGSLETFTFED